jgi:hypothetical protein
MADNNLLGYREAAIYPNATPPSMGAYDPSRWDRLRWGAADTLSLLGLDPRFARRQSENLLGGGPTAIGLADVLPGASTPRAVHDYNMAQGIIPTALAGAGVLLSALPGGGAARGAAKATGLLGRAATSTPGRILRQTKEEGGYTVNLAGDVPGTGIMMGKYANVDPRNVVIPKTRVMTLADLKDFAYTNRKALEDPENYIGTWRDADGTVYVDVSKRFEADQIRKATKFGERTQQKAGFDIGEGAETPVGNWEGFVKGPEFMKRMEEMEKVGRDYLDQYPAQEWWDIHGTGMERVYGAKNMPQAAGFIAATAPNTAPRPNIQTASEYMRRHIKGEPIIQPDWRVPEGEMTRQAGTKIGMETGRTANLLKADRGALDELRLSKVREEAAALMGDPSAFVGDRHWARLAEKPQAGIFTAAEPGSMGSQAVGERNYAILKEAVGEYAGTVGRPLRDVSADIWTGVRETIKRTDDLYGQKMKGSAITGESTSYADQFDTLVRDKARHLGIGVKEMERRLSKGDATLLSAVLAMPLGLAALKIWQGSSSREVD